MVTQPAGRVRGRSGVVRVVLGTVALAAVAVGAAQSVSLRGRVAQRLRAVIRSRGAAPPPGVPVRRPLPAHRPPPPRLLTLGADVVLWVVGVAAAIALLLLLGSLAYRLWLARPGRRAPGTTALSDRAGPEPGTLSLAGAAGQARWVLDATADPRAAVIACWVALTESLADHGVASRPSDTAADLLNRAREAGLAQAAAAELLAELYRRARYSPHPIDASAVDQARAHLVALGAPRPTVALAGFPRTSPGGRG